ncbi:RNA polymerase sigma factor [Actinoallomurus soli]|uniref:RNA polymerase sigma factor n=1 Tax=Actinoallomurus soli TaxID=2952535 RepID=UPI00209250DC|nr:RNA polymerase sigma factor [Actinoallomurus soli]MCO5973848.1 RNA polymerase sigma factor [Actinoallomurus soli]
MIFERYYARIHRYVSSRLGPSAADDVAADTFLAAFDQRRRYDLTRPEAGAWLFGIATNLIGRHRRSEVRRYRAMARVDVRDDSGSHEDKVADRVSAERMQPRLAAALAALSKGDRDVLLLVACGQLTYDEVALALGIPAGTVGSRLNRAKKRLRTTLGKEMYVHG